jgi:hypothetical protein
VGIKQMIWIELTWGELHLAGTVGLMRLVSNLKNGRKDRYGLEHADLGADLEWRGAIGELAVAKYWNRFWYGSIGNYGVRDVGDAEVRTVTRPDHRLILHEGDRDNAPYVSVLVMRERLPHIALRGWINGIDGKQREFWSDPNTNRPAFFVPNDRLLPMEQLKQRGEST